MSILGTLPQGNIVFCDLRRRLSVLSFPLLQTISAVQIYLPRMSGTFRLCQV